LTLTAYAMSEPQEPEGPELITAGDVLKTLTGGAIQEEHGLLPWGSNYAYLVSVADDERTLLAVYKPQRGERPLWDFPEGTLCYREVAAFFVSEALEWQLVPPTVLRSGPYGLGSVQFFVHHDPEISYFTPFPEDVQPQLQYFAVFDYLINNADRKGSHCLLAEPGHLWGIDHGISFHHQRKLRTVIWDYAGEPIPEPILESLQAFCDKLGPQDGEISQALKRLLTLREISALRRRLDYFLESRTFVQPGPGINYPWPPV
jgi:uncharacterized repeat protein (TIGR03843 family)